jgi:hypothetical protein
MSENNGWPGKPGVPTNPERDGWHWIKPKISPKRGIQLIDESASRPMPWNIVSPLSHKPAWNGVMEPEHAANVWQYLGPCLTPAEVDARVKEAETKIAAGCLISNAAEVADLVLLNPDRWRGAINDALTNWLSTIEDHETPKDALQRLIRLEVMAALDPAVSQSAADLVAQAKRGALIKAAARVSNYAVTAHQHGSLPIDPHQCAKQVAWEITASITAMAEKGEGDD